MGRRIRGTDKSAELVEAVFGPDMVVTGHSVAEEPGGRDYIDLESARDWAVCPACGKRTGNLRKNGGAFTREIQFYPVITAGRPTMVRFHGRQFVCTDPGCAKSGFREQPDFARAYQRKAVCMCILLVAFSAMLSFSGASVLLSLIGVVISADSLQNMFSKLDIPDDPDVEAIGVDDVCNRKGQTYLTAVYALSGHRCLALLPGRDGGAFEEWLLNHPKVRLVCRDRASGYAKAVDAACRKLGVGITQVADRFHLLQNCSGHIKDALYQLLPSRVAFDKSKKELLEKIPMKRVSVGSLLSAEEMDGFDYDNSAPVDASGRPVEIDMGSAVRGKKAARDAQKKRDRKHGMALAIRKKFNPAQKHAPQYRELGKEFGISPGTARKYAAMSDEEVEALKHPAGREGRPKEIDGYKNMIYKMIKDGRNFPEIFSYVKRKGCLLADTTLMWHIKRVFMGCFPEKDPPEFSEIAKSAYPENVEVFTRTDIFRAFMCVTSPVDERIRPYLELIQEAYPVCAEIKEKFLEFHAVIMGKDPDALDGFLEKHADSDLGGFCESLKRDITPVKNAISMCESSGFVEGNNNKFKLLKRTLYGRAGIKNLEIRAKVAFLLNTDGFNIQNLLGLCSGL